MISMSVTLLSPLCLFPGAETTIYLLSVSASTIDLIFLSWSASATDDPPNLITFTPMLFLQSSSILFMSIISHQSCVVFILRMVFDPHRLSFFQVISWI